MGAGNQVICGGVSKHVGRAGCVKRDGRRGSRRAALLSLVAPLLLAGAPAHSGRPGAAGTDSAVPGAPWCVVKTKVPDLFGTRSEPPVGMPLAFGDRSAWVLAGPGVERLNAATGKVEAEVTFKGRGDSSGWPRPENLAFAGGDLWAESVVIGTRGYLLTEVDPASDRVVRETTVDSGPEGPLNQGLAGNFQTMAAVGTRLVVEHGDTVVTVSSATGDTLSVVREQHPPVFADVDGTDVKVPEQAVLAAENTRGGAVDFTVAGTDVWATTWSPRGRFELTEFDANTGAELGTKAANVWLVASGAGQLWGETLVTELGAPSSLVQISPSSGRVERRLPLPSIGGGTNPFLAVAYGALWLVHPEAGVVYRVGC